MILGVFGNPLLYLLAIATGTIVTVTMVLAVRIFTRSPTDGASA